MQRKIYVVSGSYGFTYFLRQGKKIVLGKTLQKRGACKRFRHAPHRQITYGGQLQVSVLPAPTWCRAQCQK